MEENEDGTETVTSSEYRYKYLSTIIAGFVAIWFPLWITAASIEAFGVSISFGGSIMAVLTMGWLTVLAYSVGTDTLKAVYEARS